MNEEARKAAARYAKEWRRKNPEKVKATRERYWTRRAKRSNEKAEAGKGID